MTPRLPLLLVLVMWSTSALAHDARSAAVTVEVVGTGAVVHLAATQAGLHAALEAAAGRALDPADEDYGALVAEHIRTTLRLSADGQPLAVGDVGLRLGGHQSDARFAVELPEGADLLTVAVDVLVGVEGQQAVVRIRHDGETTQAVLSDESRAVTVALALPPALETERPTDEAAVAAMPRAPWVLALVALVSLFAVARWSATPA